MQNYRLLYGLITLIALFSLSAALFFQYYDHLEPCILCIMQRLLFLGLFIVSGVAVIHNPKRWGLRIYSFLLSIISLTGVGVAARQIWLQHLPMAERPLCAPGVEFIFDHYLWSEILPLFFTGSGDCGEITWQLWGLSMPLWSLLLFGVIVIISGLLFLAEAQRQKGG